MPGTEPVGPGEYRDWAHLESAAYRPFQSFGGTDVYPTLAKKGAALFHSLIANHPFHNGNKRTALIALDLFLTANGWLLNLPGQDMYALAKATASYRERGESHDKEFLRIASMIGQNMTSFVRLRKTRGSADLYKACVSFRRNIRKFGLNHPQPF